MLINQSSLCQKRVELFNEQRLQWVVGLVALPFFVSRDQERRTLTGRIFKEILPRAKMSLKMGYKWECDVPQSCCLCRVLRVMCLCRIIIRAGDIIPCLLLHTPRASYAKPSYRIPYASCRIARASCRIPRASRQARQCFKFENP